MSRTARTANAVIVAAWVRAGGHKLHACGDKLWLRVHGTAASWVWRYRFAGQERSMGLGSYAKVTLAEARKRARAAQAMLDTGADPAPGRALAAPVAPSFTEAAAQYIASHEAGWRNAVHRQQWRSTLATYAQPIADKPVHAITVNDVLALLLPIWTVKPETAARVRGRIEMVLSYAKARGWRTGENPAAWRDNLKLLLPAQAKVRAVRHHAALDWRQAPEFMRGLAVRDTGMGSRALQFAILTAARAGEVRLATWDEIDLDARLWTVPGARMKAGKAHKVPLSDPALAILAPPVARKQGSLIFPSPSSPETPLSNMTLTAVLRRMGRGDLTVHGFRSTFRDWCAEVTMHPTEVAEMALAHAVGDKVEAAYRRGDLFEKRRRLMDDWAAFVTSADTGVIVPLPTRAAS
jgi:integrase